MEHERFDRVVAAGATNGDGFSSDDVAWLLENAAGEILILRPSREAGKAIARMGLSGRTDNRPGAEARRIYRATRRLARPSEGMTRSSGSSSGCQRTPRTKPPSSDSIASTLSSSVAHALADSESGISSTPW